MIQKHFGADSWPLEGILIDFLSRLNENNYQFQIFSCFGNSNLLADSERSIYLYFNLSNEFSTLP